VRLPIHQVIAVQAQTEDVRRDKPGLCRFHPDQTNDHAVGPSHNPALPQAAANQNCGHHRQKTRDVIETQYFPWFNRYPEWPEIDMGEKP
jgi:hypothetical protein